MVSRVSTRIRVSVKLLDELNPQGGLFLGFPNRSSFQTLTTIDKTAGQSPALGKIFLSISTTPPPASSIMMSTVGSGLR